MAKITILEYNSVCLFHWCTHLEAIIEDEATGRTFNIDFANFAILNDKTANQQKILETQKNGGCCLGVITLYSNKSFDRFLMDFYHEFGNLSAYSYTKNNCSQAVDFALDFFFPDKAKTNAFYCLFQSCCSWLCIGTCGVKYFPVPPCTNSPHDVFRKGELLACCYGSVPFEDEKETHAVVCEAKGWNSEKLSQFQSCETGLSLAIINKEKNIIEHFLEKHLHGLVAKQVYFALFCLLVTRQDTYMKTLQQKYPDLFQIKPVNDVKAELKEEKTERFTVSFSEDALKLDYSLLAFRGLLKVAILNDATMDVMRFLCSYKSARFISIGLASKKSKFDDGTSILQLAQQKQRADIEEYLVDNHLEQFTSMQLGTTLLNCVGRKDYERSKTLVKKRPDIHKNWHQSPGDNYVHHLLASQENPDVELFRLLCESKPIVDLKRKNAVGDTAVSLAIKNNHHQLVAYMVEKHSQTIIDELPAAKKYLDEQQPIPLNAVRVDFKMH